MNKLICTISILMIAYTGQASAGHNHFYDYARVIKAEPVYQSTYYDTPVRHCRHSSPRRYDTHSPYNRHHRSYSHYHNTTTPTVVGAIIGGAIGNALGHNKSNKKVGLAAGAILGGAIAHDISHHETRQHRRYESERHCSVSYEHSKTKRRLEGYHVTYRYKGERYHTFTQEHPGHKIRIKVDVSPAVHDY